LGTYKVALGRETHSHLATAGGILTLLRPIENAAANFAGPASGLRGGTPLTHSSQSTLVGTGIVTDTIRVS